ncbi:MULTISPECIES: hypothetical protein [Clostridia]|uniref:hypothetical protein n=1 Tax=Clostridia TaxID=186801 RepID=UPI000EA31F86|nr:MULTISPECIES: hypothetical protein [Clostridia]NBJ70922.1 hypothetical protein [Roseburia sp. 1XD42-34]RKI75565.1 hypothetical protein D7V87_15875 [Clostridium sp. 1xD42-85]
MKQFIQPILFLILTGVAFILNILGLMQVIPLYITLPLLFITIYLTIYSFAHRRTYRGMR